MRVPQWRLAEGINQELEQARVKVVGIYTYKPSISTMRNALRLDSMYLTSRTEIRCREVGHKSELR